MKTKDSTNEMADAVDQKRRQSVKKALLTATIPTAVAGVAHKWEKPAIEAVFLPAHANMTADTGTAPDMGTTPMMGTTMSPEPTPMPELTPAPGTTT